MKNPTLGIGSRVFVPAEEQEGTVIKIESCGRVTVQLDCDLIDYYEVSELVRLKVKLNLHEDENHTKR